MDDQFLWWKKYQPHTVEECILPVDIKNTFQEYVNKKNIPDLLLTGPPGIGKTTIAIAMCDEVGCDYLFIPASDETGVENMRTKLKGYASAVSLTGGRKVVILDEADYLSSNAQALLRGAIQEFAGNCSFIFTCNFKSRLMDAIHSRCTTIDFKIKNGEKAKIASVFFKRIESILTQENVKFDKQVVAAVITKHFPDFRRILNELQKYGVSGVIDAGILSQVSDIQIKELITALKNKDFGVARKWVTNNADSDSSRVFRKLYDTMSEYLKPQSIPQLVLILAKYQYQAAFVSDQEINLVAFLTEVMIDCSFIDNP